MQRKYCAGITSLPLGLRKTTENDAAVLPPSSVSLGPTSSAYPSLSPTSSSHPSLRPSSHPSLSPTTTPFFKQKGQPKNGNAPKDLFGGTFSLSTDGSTLAVTALQLGPMPNRSGYVTIMKWNDTFYGITAGDRFGDTLQMSSDGRTLVVGARSSDTNGEDAGEVRVYRWDETDSSFKLNGTLYGAKNDRFGYSLSISPDGGVIAAGAIGSASANNTNGYVKTYSWDADSLVYKQQGFPIYGDTPNGQFGWSCSLSSGGKYLAISAIDDVSAGGSFDDSTVEASGQVKVYEGGGTTYKQVGDTLSGDRNKDDFGSSISISGDGNILVVGAPENDTNNGVKSGQVKLFKLNDSGSNYTLFGEPLLGEASSNYFGGPVAIAGDAKSFAIGAVGNGNQGEFSGQLQIFNFPSS